jgi:hypothetical protein
MTDDTWDEIFREVREGGSGPWLCPVCEVDDPTVVMGQRFTRGQPVRSVVECRACAARAEVPV